MWSREPGIYLASVEDVDARHEVVVDRRGQHHDVSDLVDCVRQLERSYLVPAAPNLFVFVLHLGTHKT